ncbi:MAG: flagellar biosynthetic protein FliO [Bryobacteraceae bacterium]
METFSQSIAAFLVLLLLVAFLWAMRRRGLASFNVALSKSLTKQKVMQVVERLPLTAHHSLHLVRIQDRVILIGVSPSSCTQIDAFAASKLLAESGERL